ncbi:proteoglycan [Salix suchowensis]|nr:proteoglycan [Salix suchowensis]
MSNQPAPSRPWFRLPSIARPTAPIPTPTPEPPTSQPRPATARPAFRPTPPAATAPPVSGVASVPTSPVVKAAGGVASVPTSPDPRASAPSSPVPTSAPTPYSSVPTSPANKPVTTTSSVSTSPATKPVTTTSSVPTSPARKPVTVTSPVPTSPARKPVTVTSSVPTSPARKPVTVTSLVPTSPVSKSVTVTSSVPTSPATEALTTNATRVPSPGPSLRAIKPAVQTPPQSPKRRSTAPPPSPLTLPPSQVKSYADPMEPKIPLVAEQKTVLVQKTIDKPKVARDPQRDFTESLSSGIARLAKQENAKDVQTREKGNRKKNSSDSEDVGMKVITIAGENKGAFMEVIRSPKKQVFEGTSHFLHKKGNPKSEGSDSSKSQRKSNGAIPLSAFVNSNVQGVNNSIAYNSSCSHHDPGVHVSLSRKPSGAAAFHVKDHGNGYQS